MKTNVLNAGFILVFLLTGCATHTGVVSIGDGIYMLGKQDTGFTTNWSSSKVKAELFREGAAFCGGLGKRIVPVGDIGQDATFSSYASAEIKFRCVN